jgi:hypothetical protein
VLTACGGTSPAPASPPPPAPPASPPPHAAAPFPGFKALGEDSRDAAGLTSGLSNSNRLKMIDASELATRCSDVLARAQWEQDVYAVATPEAHFDNCFIDASVAYLRKDLALADSLAAQGKTFDALAALGRVVHSTQDFYIHTNYVELAAAKYPNRDDAPVVDLWSPTSDATLAELRVRGLVSGTVLYILRDQCPSPKLTHADLNKDEPDSTRGKQTLSPWNVSHHRAAYDLAHAASSRLVRERLKSTAWSLVRSQCGENYGFALAFDKRR